MEAYFRNVAFLFGGYNGLFHVNNVYHVFFIVKGGRFQISHCFYTRMLQDKNTTFLFHIRRGNVGHFFFVREGSFVIVYYKQGLRFLWGVIVTSTFVVQFYNAQSDVNLCLWRVCYLRGRTKRGGGGSYREYSGFS